MHLFDKLSIQSKLLAMLLLTSIAAILVTGWVGYNSGKAALTNTISNQLVSLRTAKAQEIRSYFEFLENQTLSLSESPRVIDAMKAFKTAYRKLNTQTLQPAQQRELENYYTENFLPQLTQTLEKGEPSLENYLPQSAAGKYLQYHYRVKNPKPGKEIELEKAGDGSEYSQVHERFHPLFKSLIDRFKFYDLYLVDTETGAIVYSAAKEADLGTNLETGPYASSNLAKALELVQKSRDPNFVTSVDFEPYRGSLNKPSAFIATTIFDDNDFIGAMMFQAPIDEINKIMTAQGEWEKVGLGKTGETYLIGPDFLLRSLPRLFVEDKDQYFKALQNANVSKEKIDYIKRVDTPISAQEVRTQGAQNALAGKEETVFYNDYRNVPVIAAVQPIRLSGFNWGLVAKIDQSEAFAPVSEFTKRLLGAAAILIPLITVLSHGLAGIFVKPIKKLIAGTRRIEQGETEVQVNLRSRDEFGELGKSFNRMASSLHEKETRIQETLQENDKLLLNLLPPVVAKRFKAGEHQVADAFPSVSVLYAEIEGFNELAVHLTPDQSITLLSDIVSAFDDAAEPYGIEKMKTGGNAYVAVCGLSIARVDHAKRTMDYAIELLHVIHHFNQQHGTNLSLDIGIHSGPVVGGVIGKSQFVFTLTGDTMKVAHAIHSSPKQNVIQVTQLVYEALYDSYGFERLRDLEVKGVGQIPVWALKTDEIVDSANLNDATIGVRG